MRRWYRKGEARELVPEYYFVLRSVLRAKPHLGRCLVRCRHCGIFFFTDPRNAGRKDLGCPFGCRRAHRRKCSLQRSTEYNKTSVGKEKKKRINAKRRGCKPDPIERSEVESAAQDDASDVDGLKWRPEGREFDAHMVEYLRLTTRLIEGRAVSREEVLEMLRRVVRQHSMGRERRMDYVVRHLNKHPP